jgi:hypothetical protein
MIQSSTSGVKKSIVSYPAGGSAEAGAAISFVLKLAAGDQVSTTIWHNTGSSKTLRIKTASDPDGDGFVNLSVAEL